MSNMRRTFADLSFDEKLTIIGDYLGSIKQTDSKEILAERMEWLRRHIPAYDGGDGGNYVFVSYSHKDFKSVYNDLAFFYYNTRKRVRFWYDEGLPAGDDWFEIAEKHLNDHRCVGVIFYLSENLLRSPAVLQEIELVKKMGKPYFTISLENNKFCAEDYLDKEKDSELLDKVEPVFPRNDTSVSYGSNASELFPEAERIVTYDDEYENAFYRIQKIEQAFSVVDDLTPDFVCEEVEDGLSLVAYQGFDTNVYVPERIGRKEIVEIKASFDNATEIFIPKTVKRILPVTVEAESQGFDESDEGTWSLHSVALMLIGGYQSPGAIFGRAQNLTSIEVDTKNPVFYSKDGILYKKDGVLARMPANHEWNDEYLEGINTIGISAFYAYQNSDANISLPSSVEHIEGNAFAYADIFYLSMQNGLKTIGESAFASCKLFDVMPIDTPNSLESIGEFAFANSPAGFITLQGNGIKEIPRGLFLGANADYISIPDSTQLIHKGAFALCGKLEEIKLPGGVLGIDDHAFFKCEKLYSINLPRSIRYLSPETFSTDGLLKYIFYEGGSKELYYFRRVNDIEETKYPELIVNKDQLVKRLMAKGEIAIRKKAIALLEKLNTPKAVTDERKANKKKTILSQINSTTVISFMISLALLFFIDYRRLVLERPVDWIYWLIAAIGLALLFYGSKHVYWSYIVNKHKKKAKTKSKEDQPDYLDAWTSVGALGLFLYGIFSFIITLIISGAFNLDVIRKLIESFK